MKKKITIISSAQMGPGTFEAKFLPLSRNTFVDKIYVLRKSEGPVIDKLHYIILPTIFHRKIIGFLVRPLYLLYYTIKTKADIVLSYHIIPHAFFAFFAAFLTGKKLIIAQTGLFIQNKVKNTLFHTLTKPIFYKMDYLLVPGSNSYNFWLEMKVTSKKLNILHSTIDTEYFIEDTLINKEYDFIILSRLVHEKRVDILIDIFHKLKLEGFNFKVVIVGDGNKYNDLVQLVSKYHLDEMIDFVGFQMDTKLWFNKAKYYLMYSFSEGLPTSLMQAMSCGLVPITTDVGNIPDLVNESNGFIYSFEQQGEYLKTLKLFLYNFDEKRYIEYSNNCRNTIVENHSYQSAIKKWNSLFKELNL